MRSRSKDRKSLLLKALIFDCKFSAARGLSASIHWITLKPLYLDRSIAQPIDKLSHKEKITEEFVNSHAEL
jgi:hypothetical protein